MTSAPSLPAPVAALADHLAALHGVVAVVLGGSRATGTHRPDSDWDLGVYYRSSRAEIDPAEVRSLGYDGYVSAVGEWGPIVNGGAWLTAGHTAVDVLYRDLDQIERWTADAEEGRFEVLAQNGYLAGAPTYLPAGELAIAQPISGDLPRPGFPEALARSAPERWRGRARVALLFAATHARAGDAVCCTGMLSLAVLSAAHARLAEQREWVLNEKRLVARAGFADLQRIAAAAGSTAAVLEQSTRAVASGLGIEALAIR